MAKSIAAAICLVAFGLAVFVPHQADAQGCAELDAAITHQGQIHFCIVRQVRVFSQATRTEIDSGSASEKYIGFPRNTRVSAAYHPLSEPSSTILITANKYFKFGPKFRRLSDGPLSDIFPNSKAFSAGIDPAATFQGKEYFFKGCSVLIRPRNGRARMFDLRKLTVPCYVRSAWVNMGSLVVSKGTQARRMDGKGGISKPFCFANRFTTSLNICKCKKRQ